MKKCFALKSLLAAPLCAVVLVCGVQPAGAAQHGAGISPVLFVRMMRLAGLDAATQPGAEDYYSAMVTIQGFNTNFTMGFPAGGIKKDVPFYLASDEYAAVVQFSDAGGLAVIDGDERIIATGIFGMVACILTTVAIMVSEILTAALSLNIFGILEAVMTGVASILACVFKIVA